MEKYTSELEMDNLGEIQKPKKLNTDSWSAGCNSLSAGKINAKEK